MEETNRDCYIKNSHNDYIQKEIIINLMYTKVKLNPNTLNLKTETENISNFYKNLIFLHYNNNYYYNDQTKRTALLKHIQH